MQIKTWFTWDCSFNKLIGRDLSPVERRFNVVCINDCMRDCPAGAENPVEKLKIKN